MSCRPQCGVDVAVRAAVSGPKSIADFRRLHRQAVSEAGLSGCEVSAFVGLIRGEWM